ncbi:MAG: hypothetical protein M1828_001035 [Chrysothrix sp. TS-e1954]|nr:MAG: hypothetical protein M1828_001035 [Chrysothrix sp. TS-e1954]
MALTPTTSNNNNNNHHHLSPPLSPISTTSPTPGDGANRSRAPSRLSLRSLAPSSFYANLASEPPKAEDFYYPEGSDYSVDAWFSGFRHSFEEESDELPDLENLKHALQLPVYDSNGQAVPFKDISQGPHGSDQAWGERRLVIFIRHFFCQACESYTRALTSSLSNPLPSRDSQLSTASITLISCGKPSLIKPYIQRTGCPFSVYADPGLKVFKALGCKRWGGLSMGKSKQYLGDLTANEIKLKTFGLMAKASLTGHYRPRTPASPTSSTSTNASSRRPSRTAATPQSNNQDPNESSSSSRPSSTETDTTRTSTSSTGDLGRQGKRRRCLGKRLSLDGFRGGPILQVGGEFLFEDGRLLWCHRMRNIRDHAEVRDIKRVLDLPAQEEEAEEQNLDAKDFALDKDHSESATKLPRAVVKEPSEQLALPDSPPLQTAPQTVNTTSRRPNRKNDRWSLGSITEIAMRLQEEERIPCNNASAQREEDEAAYLQRLSYTKSWVGQTPRSSMITPPVAAIEAT